MNTLPGAAPLPNIQPDALPALQSLVLSLPNLTSPLPGSWGASPNVLPALKDLRMYVGDASGSLPAEWASGGFRRLRNLVLGCTEGFKARYRVPTARRAAAAAAAAAPPPALPAAWGAGALPALTSLTLVGLHLGGAFPASWLAPGAFPALGQLRIDEMDMSGPLPERLFEAFPSLTSLAFTDCLFNGTLPSRWGDSAVRLRPPAAGHNTLGAPPGPAPRAAHSTRSVRRAPHRKRPHSTCRTQTSTTRTCGCACRPSSAASSSFTRPPSPRHHPPPGRNHLARA